MESLSSEQKEVIENLLQQIRQTILNLQEWNADVADMNQLALSPSGMQRLAGNCMLIQAIGEGFKKIGKYTNNEIFKCCPEIPWRQVMGMRDKIAHGYFDLDIEYITDVINNDLAPLLKATDTLIASL